MSQYSRLLIPLKIASSPKIVWQWLAIGSASCRTSPRSSRHADGHPPHGTTAFGTFRISDCRCVMSDVGGEADIETAGRHFRF